MLSAITFGSNRLLVSYIVEICALVPDLCVYKTLYTYPTRVELAKLLNTFGPEIVFVDLVSSPSALAAVGQIRASRPKTAIIGFVDRVEEEKLRAATEAGVTEVLPAPCEPEEFTEAVLRAVQSQAGGVPENVIVFLPSKAGSGASTIALHAATFLAGDWGKRVVLLETDQYSGAMAARLDLEPEASILDVLENSQWLNDESWPRMTNKVHGFDLMPMPLVGKGGAISPWDYQRLVTFVRSRYDTVIADFSELMDPAADWIAAQARLVYVVSTQEKASLFLARRRIHQLKSRGVADRHIRVILNRSWQRGWDLQTIEKLLERPMAVALPYDETLLRRSPSDASLIDRESDLGRALRSFVRVLAGPDPPALLPGAEAKSGGLLARFRQKALAEHH